MDMVSAVFEQAFTTVSNKLLGLSVQKKEQEFLTQKPLYRVMIYTTGYIQLEITCLFPQELLRRIVCSMYGGEVPPEGEIPLYIKEYVNIVCGHGISQLNNQLGKASRLSVPFYQDEIPHRDGVWQQTEIDFDTGYGTLSVVMKCSEEEQ